MGLLKKLFVEEIPNNENVFGTEAVIAEVEEPVPEVALDEVNTDTLIEDIYAQNELQDKSKSIFKVEELINSLPKEMVTETKKNSVLAILTSFGLTAEDVVLDGENRATILIRVLSKIAEESENVVREKQAEIEDHKMEIARLEKEIAEQQEEMKISHDVISGEKRRVQELIYFITGGNA